MTKVYSSISLYNTSSSFAFFIFRETRPPILNISILRMLIVFYLISFEIRHLRSIYFMGVWRECKTYRLIYETNKARYKSLSVKLKLFFKGGWVDSSSLFSSLTQRVHLEDMPQLICLCFLLALWLCRYEFLGNETTHITRKRHAWKFK